MYLDGFYHKKLNFVGTIILQLKISGEISRHSKAVNVTLGARGNNHSVELLI